MNNQSTNALPKLTLICSDDELVQHAVQGHTQAFELIMRRYNRLLFRTARSILKNDTETEDVLQEAYVKAWRALGNFMADSKLSTWLVRIVVNESLGRLRKQTAQIIGLNQHADSIASDDSAAQSDHLQPEVTAISVEMRRMLEKHIDSLPDVFRTVFVLRAVEELSVEEVASVLNIPEATVRSRFFRARGLLRETLARNIDLATADAFAFDGLRCDRIAASVLQRITSADGASFESRAHDL